jgi:uncharacterized protein (TIGR02145 family)
MVKRVQHTLLFTGIIAAILFSSISFAQKATSSANSGTTTKTTTNTTTTEKTYQDHIDAINLLCKKYDPYVRTFSYNEKTNILKWVSKDGDVTCSASLSEVSVKTKKSGDDYLVQFSCKGTDKCIDCNYGGATNLSSITLTSKDAADKIVGEVLSMQISYLAKSITETLKNYKSDKNTTSGSYSSSIDRINKLCRDYDPYGRVFSYSTDTKIFKWVTKTGDITNSAKITEIDAIVEPSGSNYYVTFKSKNGSKCISSDYSGPVKESAITLKTKSAAEEIVSEFNKIVSSVTVTKNKKVTTSSKSVKIGREEWMSENLDVDRFRNGDIIPEVKSKEDWVKAAEDKTPAWCYYENNSENGSVYGRLYNWYAVNDPRGLAPKGWHIPSKNEWEAMFESLGGSKVAGEKMKEMNSWFADVKADGNCGFNALPGGFRYIDGTFDYMGKEKSSYFCATFWASDDMEAAKGWYIFLSNGNENAGGGNASKVDGVSVRCIKD